MQYVVYTIKCNSQDVQSLYVGSSRNIKKRLSLHKYHANRETNTIKLYSAIREHGGFDNWIFEVVESGRCETKSKIKSRERFYFDKLKPDLNMIRPQVSKEERRSDKLEKMKQYRSQKIQYEICKCECGKADISTHKTSKKHLNNLQMMSNAQ